MVRNKDLAMKKKVKKMAGGGMPMVEKEGKMVPAFAADGKGKMNIGGMAKPKMYNKGGMANCGASMKPAQKAKK
jgi:hypothetical protein